MSALVIIAIRLLFSYKLYFYFSARHKALRVIQLQLNWNTFNVIEVILWQLHLQFRETGLSLLQKETAT